MGFIARRVTGLAIVIGCITSCTARSESDPSLAQGSATMKITSTAFAAGDPIPVKYTGDGDDKSPPLKFADIPAAAKSLALIVDDPDAPSAEPWVHWVIWNMPAHTAALPEAEPRKQKLIEPAGAVQGNNSWPSNNLGYRGPAPPKGHGVHHYHFKLYALDTTLDLAPGSSKSDLLAAMADHIVGQGELVGTYERK